METPLKTYKYDIGFSLCKQDIQFARDLIAQLNPSIKVFFYENNQEELIAKSGPEAFGRIFNNECRIVVILSRNEWSETYYTDIERNAIIDRTSVRNEGYNFLVVMPMAPGEIPSWYPRTKIYADPQHWSIDRLASFIEFKLADEGGIIKKLTLEDRYTNLQERIASKKKLVDAQSSSEALQAVRSDIDTINETVLNKIDVFKENAMWPKRQQSWPHPLPGAYFGLGEFILEIKVASPDESYQRIVLCQDYLLKVALYVSMRANMDIRQDASLSKPITTKDYRYLYNGEQRGWAIPFIRDKSMPQSETEILFRHREPDEMQNAMRYYDLKDPVSSKEIIDEWFQHLFDYASSTIEKYI